MNGNDKKTKKGVHNRHFNGTLARIEMTVASIAYNVYKTGVTPRAIKIFHVARTSRPAILTTDAARASARRLIFHCSSDAEDRKHTFRLLARDYRSQNKNRSIQHGTRESKYSPS